MTDLQEKAMTMALERLESLERPYWMDEEAIQALRQALAQPEQEPVARVDYDRKGNIAWLYGPVEPDGTLLYTAPQKREWVGKMTKEQIICMANDAGIDCDTDGDIFGSTNGSLERFAALVAAAERDKVQEVNQMLVEALEITVPYLPAKTATLSEVEDALAKAKEQA